MNQSQQNLWEAALRHGRGSILLATIIALTVTLPSIVKSAGSDSAVEKALVQNEPKKKHAQMILIGVL